MITIRAMTKNEFSFVMEAPHTDYAKGMARAEGMSFEEAKKKADEQVGKILSDGFETAGHHFYSAELDGEFAGFAWVQIKEENNTKMALGFNIYVREEFRRRGVAKKVFDSLLPTLKDMGVKHLAFHVYGDNHHAIALYEALGFRTTNMIMKKEL